jgi:hypothetical protein
MSAHRFSTAVLIVSGSIASCDVAAPRGYHSTFRARGAEPETGQPSNGRGNASIGVTATPEFPASSLFAPASESTVPRLVDH